MEISSHILHNGEKKKAWGERNMEETTKTTNVPRAKKKRLTGLLSANQGNRVSIEGNSASLISKQETTGGRGI